MESGLFFGGSIVAATIAGSIALFAPCCISFMLPAYFASAFQNRRLLVAMTFLFGAGVATVILPIALGASFLRQIFTDWHPYIYVTGGALLFGLAIYTLLGGQIHLPTPGRRAGGRTGPLGVYTLGVFSGVTSSCCAPVLAAVIALSSVAPSFISALGLGVAYVFGMVAPLFVISLLWERYDWRSSKLLRPRSFTWRVAGLTRTLSGSQLASGLLLLVLGAAMLWNGLTLRSMYRLTGWQAALSYELQHLGAGVTRTLTWIPNWLAILAVFGVFLLLARRALGQMSDAAVDTQDSAAEPPAQDASHPQASCHDGKLDGNLVRLEKSDAR